MSAGPLCLGCCGLRTNVSSNNIAASTDTTKAARLVTLGGFRLCMLRHLQSVAVQARANLAELDQLLVYLRDNPLRLRKQAGALHGCKSMSYVVEESKENLFFLGARVFREHPGSGRTPACQPNDSGGFSGVSVLHFADIW